MTDAHRPVPHPRPAPNRARPEAGEPVLPDPNLQQTVVLPAVPAGAALAEPLRVPPAPIEPTPTAPPRIEPTRIEPELPPSPRSRAERRRVERASGRQQQLRRWLPAAAVLLCVVIVVAVVLALTSGGSTPRKHAAPPPTPTPSATGADLDNPDQASTFLGAASADVAAVTTYDYRHLDDALTAGLAVTTGQYREAYRTALTGDLARTATAEHVIHAFELLDIGIGQMTRSGSQAKVLVFGRERINDDRTGPDTQLVPITLVATIRRNGDLYRISDLVENADAGLPPGGPELAVANAAARAEVVNILSFRRAQFDADEQHALEGATSPLREQLQKSVRTIKKALTKGKYDLSAAVTGTAVVRADADTVTLLVAADASKITDGNSTPSVTQRRYEVTVTRTLDSWAASRISSVDGGSPTGV